MSDWIDKRKLMPTELDADQWGCILIWDRLNGCKITGWKNVQELGRANVTHWTRLPGGPKT